MGVFRRFKTDQRGATAIIFGFVAIPLVALAGAAVDYSRASMAQTKIQVAIDQAALAIVKLPIGATQPTMDAIARNAVESVFGFETGTRSPSGITLAQPVVTRSGKTVTVRATGTSDSAFMQLLGIASTPIGASSQALWTAKKIELALVLDNTGSMAETPGGTSKIGALKASAKQLLTDLRVAAKEADTIKVSIVPFDTEVRFDPATYRSKPWFRWNNPSTDPAAWTGYAYERYGTYALSAAAPGTAVNSLYPAPKVTQYQTDSTLRRLSTASGSLAFMQPLTSLYAYSDYDALNKVIDSMTPRGYTNVSLGTTWGLATLTPGSPFTGPAAMSDKEVVKYMVILTDGENNYRYVDGRLTSGKDGADSATKTACSNAKAAGVEVFTISLVKGDANLLEACASSSANYFDVQNAGQLGSAFRKIVDVISGTRITS